MARALVVRMALMSTQREHFFPRAIRAIQAEMMMTALSTASAARMLRLVAKADKLKAKSSLASKAKSGWGKIKIQRAAKSVAGNARQRTSSAAGSGPLVVDGVRAAAAARRPSMFSTQSLQMAPALQTPPSPTRSASMAAEVQGRAH